MISEISSTYSIIFTLFWQSSLFLTAGLIASYLLKRHPARAHQTLLLSMIAAMTVPFMSVAVKHFELGMFTAKPEPEPVVEYSPIFDFISNNSTILQTYNGTPLINSEPPVVVEPEKLELPWNTILLTGWIAASIILLTRILVTFILGMRLVKKTQPFEHPKITASIKAAASKLGVRENLLVYSSKSISSPVIWCWNSRPILLLPSNRKFLSNKIDWVGILCHELAHSKRRDHIAGLFSELIVGILPWHPLLWWAKSRLIDLSERACDDWVIAAGGCGMKYAESLLDLVPVRQMAFVPAVVHSKNDLKGRVMRIVKETYGNPRLGVKWVIATILLTICIALTVAFAQTRPARTTETDSVSQQDISNESDEPMILVDLENERFIDIIEEFSEWAGKNIMYNEAVEDVRITVNSGDRIQKSEALSLILDYLKKQGATITELQEDLISIEFKPNEPMVNFNLKDAGLDVIIETLMEWTGKSIIPASEASDVKITIYAPDRMLKSKAIALIYEALLMKGFSARETKDIIFIEVVDVADQNANNISVTKSFELKYINADKAAKILNIRLGNRGITDELLFHQPETNCIIATTGKATMEIIEDWIEQLDTEEAMNLSTNSREGFRGGVQQDNNVTKVFELENINSARAVEILSNILDGDGITEAQLISVPENNWIIVKASEATMMIIEDRLEQLDTIETTEREYEIISLQYTEAQRVVDDINKMLNDMDDSITKKVFLQPLQNSNRIIVFGGKEVREMVKKLVAEFDVPAEGTPVAGQWIIEVPNLDPTEMTDFIERILAENQSQKDQILIDTKILNVSDTFLEEVGLDPNKQGSIIDDLQISFLLRAVETREDSKILAKPTVLTKDNETVTIFTGQKLPFVTGFNEPESQFEVATPVYEQRDIGLKCEYLPRITNDKNRVNMIIRINNSQIVGSEERMFNGKYKATVPKFTEMESTTNMIIPSGATLLIDCSIANPNENETDSASEQKRQIMLVKQTIIMPRSAD